ncbi:MAG: NAD-dependent epimerase/dehydratase family protein [Chloroflexi bacterium]|nr:NAD-dependent epimerase/dehydratase family protein [Chloroflexota bacterium]
MLIVTSSETPRAGQTPTSPYAASKQAMASYAEMYWLLFGLPVVVARPHMVFGPHQPPDKLIPYLIRCGLEGTSPRLASGKRLCDPVYVQDFVRALFQMATEDRALGMTLDVGTGVGLTVAQIAARVLPLTGSTQSPVFGAVPDRLAEAPQVADTTATHSVLGWKPVWPFDDAVRETIEWYTARRDLVLGNAHPTASEATE